MPCIFCDFVNGKRKIQRNDLPFLILHETSNTLSFLSMSFPEKEDGHVLVIPKKHFTYIEDIPVSIQHELIDHVVLITKALRKTHEGCNILLNDGRSAGQCVFHVHYHIIPRDKDDEIKIEIWKSKKPSLTDFKKLHIFLKKEIEKNKR